MNRRRALAWLASALYFGAALLCVRGHDAPPVVQAAAAWGMGASLSVSIAWWGKGQ